MKGIDAYREITSHIRFIYTLYNIILDQNNLYSKHIFFLTDKHCRFAMQICDADYAVCQIHISN